MKAEVITLMAIMATPHIDKNAEPRVYWGEAKALYALEQCMTSKEEMKRGFIMQIQDETKGTYQINCQMLDTTEGDYYAVKGHYKTTPTLDALVKILKEKNISIKELESD